jgi:CBS domain-containing protein
MLESSALTAADLMTTEVITVHPETPLREAALQLVRGRIGGMPVVDADGKVVGIFSEGDLVRWTEDLGDRQSWWLNMLSDGFDLAPEFLDQIRSEHNRVRAVMNKDVVSVIETTPAREIAKLMSERKFKRVPVLRDGKLVGIVARADLVRAVAESVPPTP